LSDLWGAIGQAICGLANAERFELLVLAGKADFHLPENALEGPLGSRSLMEEIRCGPAADSPMSCVPSHSSAGW
jgi:hypothetical protein